MRGAGRPIVVSIRQVMGFGVTKEGGAEVVGAPEDNLNGRLLAKEALKSRQVE